MGWKKITDKLIGKDEGNSSHSIFLFGGDKGKHEHLVIDKGSGVVFRRTRKDD